MSKWARYPLGMEWNYISFEADVRSPIHIDEKLILEREKQTHIYVAAEKQNQGSRPSDRPRV